MSIRVEFFGIPRQRAGTSATTVDGGRLGDVLTALAVLYPELAATCFDAERLRPGYLANVNGDRFVTDPDTALSPGDAVLILTADAGG